MPCPSLCSVLALFAALMALAAPARAGERVLVAVAANFAEAAEALAPGFEAETGHDLALAVGSTGKLYAQIAAGAPFDVLLAADRARPARAEAEGLAVPGTRFTYATGRLTLWSPDPARIGPDGPAALTAPDAAHIALANPDLAPYGAAAAEALAALGLTAALEDRIVMGQNIGQTFALVATGNAELGFVALSSVLSPRLAEKGSRWDVPADLYAPIRQDAVLLRHGADNQGARAFLAYLQSDAARPLLARFGYGGG